MAELAYRTGMQPSEFDAMTRRDTLALVHEVRELHRDDVDFAQLCAEVAGGTKRFAGS